MKAELRLLLRGVRELHRLTPWNLLAKCVRSVCDASRPFVNLLLSAEILDALTARAAERLPALVLATVGCNLALMLLGRAMDAVNYRKWNAFYLKYNFSVGEKLQSLPYADIEDVRVQREIVSLEDAMRIGNYGLIKLHSRIPLFVENLLRVCFSVGFLLSAVLRKGGSADGLGRFVGSPWADGILAALILLTSAACVWSNRRVADRSYTLLGRLSGKNRLLDWYLRSCRDGRYAGKDARLYRQDRLIAGELETIATQTAGTVSSLQTEIFRANLPVQLARFALVFYTYFYVAVKAMGGVFAVGGIVKYGGGVLQFADAFSGMMDASSQLRANTRYLDAYFRFRDRKEESESGGDPVGRGQTPRALDVQGLTFRYPGTATDVLRDVRFQVRPGEKIAIVGPNGSGKTTLIKLLCRLYQPTGGRILCDGADLRTCDVDAYRETLGVVFQDFRLFDGTLGENVACGTDYDRDRAADCLRRAGLGEKLDALPRGLDTAVGRTFDPNGIELSGGEAQKLALSRALYRDAPLVILDEPTASLDPLAEAELYEHFGALTAGKTALFISHRLSSCRFCDRILVFSAGKLVEQGTHEELLRNPNGVYATLWDAQASQYDL